MSGNFFQWKYELSNLVTDDSGILFNYLVFCRDNYETDLIKSMIYEWTLGQSVDPNESNVRNESHIALFWHQRVQAIRRHK